MKKIRKNSSNPEEWQLSNRLLTIVKNCESDVTVHIRGTGSKGNSTIIKDNITGQSVIVDAGLTCRKKDGVLGVLITHSHLDHVGKVSTYDVPIYIPEHESSNTNFTKQFMNRLNLPDVNFVYHNQEFTLGPFTITPLYAEHDTKNPMHYFIQCYDVSIFYGCDTVSIPEEYDEYFDKADLILLDCNYDEVLMETDEVAEDVYPMTLKERIIKKGHCSSQYIKKRMRRYEFKLIPMHLSHNYNSVDRVKKMFPDAIAIGDEKKCPLYIRIYNGVEKYIERDEKPSLSEVLNRLRNK